MEYYRRKLTDNDKKQIGLKCGCCESVENLEYHHIVPIALGGSNLLTNYVCLCNNCHKTMHTGISGLNYGKLGMIRKKEQEPPFDIKLFAELLVKYNHRQITKVKMAECLKISRPTLDNWINKGYYEKAQEIIAAVQSNDVLDQIEEE